MNNSTSMITLTSLCEATWTSDVRLTNACCVAPFWIPPKSPASLSPEWIISLFLMSWSKETKHLYTVGSSKVVESYVPPLSPSAAPSSKFVSHTRDGCQLDAHHTNTTWTHMRHESRNHAVSFGKGAFGVEFCDVHD